MRILKMFVFFFCTVLAGAYAFAPDDTSPKYIHVFVALCDNVNQGIVPVPARMGDGKNPDTNLYWGGSAGVKTWFKNSKNWTLLSVKKITNGPVLERVIFKRNSGNIYIFAEAYDGRRIKDTVTDFLRAAAGETGRTINDAPDCSIKAGSDADLLAYVGHDGLMDFDLDKYPAHKDSRVRPVIILACKSKKYFSEHLQAAGAKPFLLTTGLMAPGAYTLEAAIDGWIQEETGEKIRARAAKAYHKHQACSLKAAMGLFYSESE
jgi:hypothetical protein